MIWFMVSCAIIYLSRYSLLYLPNWWLYQPNSRLGSKVISRSSSGRLVISGYSARLARSAIGKRLMADFGSHQVDVTPPLGVNFDVSADELGAVSLILKKATHEDIVYKGKEVPVWSGSKSTILE